MGEIIGGLLMGLIAVAALIATAIVALWAAVDAQERGVRGLPVALLVLIMHIPGLLIWLIFRPEKLRKNLPENLTDRRIPQSLR